MSSDPKNAHKKLSMVTCTYKPSSMEEDHWGLLTTNLIPSSVRVLVFRNKAELIEQDTGHLPLASKHMQREAYYTHMQF